MFIRSAGCPVCRVRCLKRSEYAGYYAYNLYMDNQIFSRFHLIQRLSEPGKQGHPAGPPYLALTDMRSFIYDFSLSYRIVSMYMPYTYEYIPKKMIVIESINNHLLIVYTECIRIICFIKLYHVVLKYKNKGETLLPGVEYVDEREIRTD